MAQDTTHAEQHTGRHTGEQEPSRPGVPHTQNNPPSGHTSEQELSGQGHRTRKTTHRAGTPVNRS